MAIERNINGNNPNDNTILKFKCLEFREDLNKTSSNNSSN